MPPYDGYLCGYGVMPIRHICGVFVYVVAPTYDILVVYFVVIAIVCFHGSVAHMVERSLSMREALGSMPSSSNFIPSFITLVCSV